jgi:hypothetical protein
MKGIRTLAIRMQSSRLFFLLHHPAGRILSLFESIGNHRNTGEGPSGKGNPRRSSADSTPETGVISLPIRPPHTLNRDQDPNFRSSQPTIATRPPAQAYDRILPGRRLFSPSGIPFPRRRFRRNTRRNRARPRGNRTNPGKNEPTDSFFDLSLFSPFSKDHNPASRLCRYDCRDDHETMTALCGVFIIPPPSAG